MVGNKKYTLKQLRGLSGLTQRELAERTNLTENTISDYETKPERIRSAKISTLEKILNALGEEIGMELSINDIFLYPTRVKPKLNQKQEV